MCISFKRLHISINGNEIKLQLGNSFVISLIERKAYVTHFDGQSPNQARTLLIFAAYMKGNLKRLYQLLALVGLSLNMLQSAEAQTYTNLYSFSARDGNYLNSDGVYPVGGILCSNVLYGTSTFGGTNDGGTIFSINASGAGFTKLFDFDTLDATQPYLAT